MPKKETVFNLLDRGASFTSAVKEALTSSHSRLKHDPGIMYGALPSNQLLMIPLLDFGFQYLLNTRGLISGRGLDILGADGIGKTSLFFTICGWAIQSNVPCLHVESEGKPMPRERIMRCLHRDREVSARMFNGISFMNAFEIDDAVDKIEEWLRTIRDPANKEAYVPQAIPALVGLDTFSKLMSRAEAAGYHLYDKQKKTKGEKSTKADDDDEDVHRLGEGSNFGHSKAAHAWTRRLPSFLTKHNAVLVIIRHQNDLIDMAAKSGGGSFVSPEVKATYNRVSIGGRAFAQSVVYQLILNGGKFDAGSTHDTRIIYGQHARIDVQKTNYGPKRSLKYYITHETQGDTETRQDPAIDFAHGLPDVLWQTGMVKLQKKNNNSYSIGELKLEDLTPRELSEAFHQHPDLMGRLGEKLEMLGYDKEAFYKSPPRNTFFDLNKPKREAEEPPPAPPPPPPPPQGNKA